MNELLSALDLTLDLLKSYIKPTIFDGLKSNIGAIDFKLSQQEKKDKLLELYSEYFVLNDIQVLGGGHRYGNNKNTLRSIEVINEIKTLEEALK